ncbi:MAG: hydroxyethylthiazole kinase [Pseudolabrys sp.]
MRDPGALARDDVAAIAGATLERLRAAAPRVHCITNAVAQNFTANALLALGAVPSMTLSAEEIGAFVARSGALLVNLGTFDAERRAATAIAVETAAKHNLPWVLDPVFVDRSDSRAVYARELMARAPAAVRLNRAEFAALAGGETSPDAFARNHKTTIGLSGQTDLVADGTRAALIANGHPLMARVTAMGCAASALVAACLAVEPDAWRATASALAIIGVAGEIAAEKASGPGSFAVAILDALHNLDAKTLNLRAKVS